MPEPISHAVSEDSMPSKRMVPEQRVFEAEERLVRLAASYEAEIATLTAKLQASDDEHEISSEKIAALTEKLDAAAVAFDDEEMAHQDTLRLWQQAKAEIAALTEQRDALQQSASEWTEICEMVQQALAAATGKSAGGFMPMCFNNAIAALTERRDRAIKALRDVDAIAAQMGHSDTLGFNEAQERILEITNTALDTQSSPSLPESPEG